jgi:hypothetical protein
MRATDLAQGSGSALVKATMTLPPHSGGLSRLAVRCVIEVRC